MKYRKKPVEIEAIQFTDDLAARMLIDGEAGPFGLTASGNYHRERREVRYAWLSIKTLEGIMRAERGDWVIRGVKGELYPCKNDIFEMTYEAVQP